MIDDFTYLCDHKIVLIVWAFNTAGTQIFSYRIYFPHGPEYITFRVSCLFSMIIYIIQHAGQPILKPTKKPAAQVQENAW